MPIYVIVKNNVVVQRTKAAEPLADNWIEADVPLGSVYDTESQQFFPPGDIYYTPPQVTMRQARLVLLGAGLLGTVETALAAIENETERTAALIEWEYAATIKRNSPLVLGLTPALGLTEQQVDQLFIAAAALD